MLVRSLVFASALFLAPPASCSDKTKSVSLTAEQAISLHCVLAASKDQNRQPVCANIESYDDVIKEGDRERIVQRRYQYKPGVASVIAKNIIALRSVAEAFERNRATLQEKIFVAPAPEAVAKPEEVAVFNRTREKEMAEYTKQVRILLDAKHDFNLYAFSDAELDFAKNPFPASVLAILDPIRE